jgi:nicotinamidase-related amidase
VTNARRVTLGESTLLVVVDMQRLFIDPPDWRVPDLPSILPNVLALVRHRPACAIFTRFVPPVSEAEEQGTWRRFYRRWPMVTLQHMPREMVDLVAPLGELVPPGELADKTTYSSFESAAFQQILERRRPDALIFSGVETDSCVLASVLAAIDRGLHAIVVTDAVASASHAAHTAVLTSILPRLDQQVELTTTAAVLAAWAR